MDYQMRWKVSETKMRMVFWITLIGIVTTMVSLTLERMAFQSPRVLIRIKMASTTRMTLMRQAETILIMMGSMIALFRTIPIRMAYQTTLIVTATMTASRT